jgi:RimJ/RimL family protein N-acetyltransferase
MQQPVIETERLILREFLAKDAEALFEMDSDPEVHRFLGNTPVTDIQKIYEGIEFVRQQYIDNGIGRWVIVEKASDYVVGWTGLKLYRHEVNGHIDFYDIGYRLGRRFWNKGYATESSLASMNYGFNTLNLDTIYGTVHPLNEGSKRVFKKLGLRYVETFDMDEYGPTEWHMVDRIKD